MKTKIIADRNKFEPIKLEITIETEQELCDFWLRFNIGYKTIDKENISKLKYSAKAVDISNTGLWSTLNKLCIQRGLKI